jgi:sulfopyruvate decarboxylase TPP-binding subunit
VPGRTGVRTGGMRLSFGVGLGAGIPVIMLMSYRGELGENNWWAIPHGITMEPLLGALGPSEHN